MTYKIFVNGQPVDKLTPEHMRKLTDKLVSAIPGAVSKKEEQSGKDTGSIDQRS